MTTRDIEIAFDEEVNKPFIDMREIADSIPYEERLSEFLNWYQK